jgi:predicted DCC family thiol-disulfide oxidoreductase YuxK
MRDLTPYLEDYIMFDGKCALCANRSRYSGRCFEFAKVVNEGDTCEKFKERMRK